MWLLLAWWHKQVWLGDWWWDLTWLVCYRGIWGGGWGRWWWGAVWYRLWCWWGNSIPRYSYCRLFTITHGTIFSQHVISVWGQSESMLLFRAVRLMCGVHTYNWILSMPGFKPRFCDFDPSAVPLSYLLLPSGSLRISLTLFTGWGRCRRWISAADRAWRQETPPKTEEGGPTGWGGAATQHQTVWGTYVILHWGRTQSPTTAAVFVSDLGVKQSYFLCEYAGASRGLLMLHPGKYRVKDSVGQFLSTPDSGRVPAGHLQTPDSGQDTCRAPANPWPWSEYEGTKKKQLCPPHHFGSSLPDGSPPLAQPISCPTGSIHYQELCHSKLSPRRHLAIDAVTLTQPLYMCVLL